MKIIFIYNANSGFINTMLDIGHKAISPDTYECNLCNITHGVLSERDEWKKYRESSHDELVFLHKDEFEKQYKEKRQYPVILKLDESNGLTELMSRDELNQMNDITELIQKLNQA